MVAGSAAWAQACYYPRNVNQYTINVYCYTLNVNYYTRNVNYYIFNVNYHILNVNCDTSHVNCYTLSNYYTRLRHVSCELLQIHVSCKLLQIQVMVGSAASAGGLQPGDMLVTLNDLEVR